MIDAEVILNDGTKIWLDAYFVTRTYDDLEGDNCDPRANAFVLESGSQFTKKLWPGVQNHLLRLVRLKSNLNSPLPRVTIHAIARSLSMTDGSRDGSQVVFTWLQDTQWPLFDSRNLEYLKSINWKQVAADFSY